MSVLMHKDTPVCEINFVGKIPVSFGEIYSKELLPVGTDVPAFKQSTYISNTWYAERSVPKGRMGIENIVKRTGITPSEGFISSLGVSLTDCYWIKEKDLGLRWKDVNYFDNGFVPEFMLASLAQGDNFAHKSPDYTTCGCLEKYWTVNTGVPYLVKIAPHKSKRTIANEVVVSKAAKEMGINCVKYNHVQLGDKKGCGCNCFIDSPEVDFVTGTALSHRFEYSRRQMFDYMLSTFGDFTKKLAILDALFMQEDRHGGNYGLLIKDGDMGSAVPAPIFDSGNCLGYERTGGLITANDYKFSGTSFEKTLQRINLSIDIPIEEVRRFLQEVYEDYDISEEEYESSLLVLNHGYELVSKRQQEFSYEIEK